MATIPKRPTPAPRRRDLGVIDPQLEGFTIEIRPADRRWFWHECAMAMELRNLDLDHESPEFWEAQDEALSAAVIGSGLIMNLTTGEVEELLSEWPEVAEFVVNVAKDLGEQEAGSAVAADTKSDP